MLVGSTPPVRRGFLILLSVVFAFCVVAGLWYLGVAVGLLSRSAGSTPLGYTPGTSTVGYWSGVVGAGIIFFEMLLWFRKRWRGYRLGKARIWMWLHIWLGLVCLPLAVVHSGMTYGGAVTGMLMVLFMAVIASGAWGLAVQQIIPRKLLEDIPAETIATERQVVTHDLMFKAGAIVDPFRPPEDLEEEHHSAGGVRTAVHHRAAQLVRFHDRYIVPYLKAEGSGTGPLATRSRAAGLFEELTRGTDLEVANAAHRLEAICETRRQIDRQYTLYWWLHNWLLVHLPLSVALCVLLVVHVFYALKYW